jgi:hypothetical protein
MVRPEARPRNAGALGLDKENLALREEIDRFFDRTIRIV